MPWTLPPLLRGSIPQAAEVVKTYYTARKGDGDPEYTGALFETFAGRGDREDNRDTIDLADLVSVTMLSETVPAAATLAVLGLHRAAIATCLASIPVDRDLVDATPDDIGPDSHAWKLWHLIDSLPGVGTTRTSKVLARKRPRLLPVQDSYVTAALGHEPTDDYWATLHTHLRANDNALNNWLTAVRSAAGLNDDISTIRIFDVLVWKPEADRRLAIRTEQRRQRAAQKRRLK